MQRERQSRDESTYSGGLFDSLSNFSNHRSMFSSILGGRDPFDDPFFNRPFRSIFGSNDFDRHGSSDDFQHTSSPSELVIEELDTDDEGEGEEEGTNGDTGVEGRKARGDKRSNKDPIVEIPDDLQHTRSPDRIIIEDIDTDDEGEREEERINGDSGVKGKKARGDIRSNKDPLVEIPDDEERVSKEGRCVSLRNKVEQTKPQTQSVSFRKVTYGGINGAYYTATTSRKSGTDGVVLEESKQADRTTGQATHIISKGMQDKGHSVTRKLAADGKVDTMETLHNLNEDELAGFEQAWKGNADRHLPGWNEEFISFGRAGSGGSRLFESALVPAANRSERGGRTQEKNEATSSFGGKPKKVVRINID